MSKEDNERPEDESDITPIAVPQNGFQSRLPAYLLDGKSEAERYLLTEMSRNTEFLAWAAPILVETHREVRRTNGRLKRVEAWKAMIMNWKILAVGIGGLAAFIASVTEIWPYVKAILFGHP